MKPESGIERSSPSLPLTAEEVEQHLQTLEKHPHGYFSDLYINGALELSQNLMRSLEGASDFLVATFPECAVKASYVPELRAIRDVFNLKTASLYVPGHGNDVSHIEAFPDATRMICIDLDPASVAALRRYTFDRPAVESHLGLAELFVPDRPVDAAIFLSVAFKKEDLDFSKLLKPDAFIITNSTFRERCFSPVCLIRNGEFDFNSESFSRDRTVRTEDELKACSSSQKTANYAEVLSAVYRCTGRTTSLIEHYTVLRERALDQAVSCFKEREAAPERRARFQAANIPYFESTAEDLQVQRSHFAGREVTLTTDTLSITLKPLPAVSWSAHTLHVYRYTPLLWE